MAQPAARQWYEPEPHALRAVEEANRRIDKENRLRDSAHEWRSYGRRDGMALLFSTVASVVVLLAARALWERGDAGLFWIVVWFSAIVVSCVAADRFCEWRAARILNRLDRRGTR